MIQKFRAWSVDHQVMLDVYSIFWHPDGRIFIKAEAVVAGKHIDVQAFVGEKIILMQSTGLFDSQPEPVEIDKDDIVEYRWPYDRRLKALGVIVWREDKACFAIRNINGLGTEEVELYRLTASKHFKVLGNIHEHPYLVEGRG